MRLITAADLVDLLGAEPASESEAPGYAPVTAADITREAARTGWLSDGRWLAPAVPLRAGRPAR